MSSPLWPSWLSPCCACKMMVLGSKSPLRWQKFWDLLNSRGCTFRFFSIQLTFIISNDCCTTVKLSSILNAILVPDLLLFKFRHVLSLWQNIFFNSYFTWWRMLGKCKSKLCLKCIVLSLKLWLYDKKAYRSFDISIWIFVFSKIFFNNDSLISNIFILLCFHSTFKKRDPMY